jgi:transglutaminase-like putative cysteine protease
MKPWIVRTGAALAWVVSTCTPAWAAKPPREATDLPARVELLSEQHVVSEDGSEVSTYRSVTRVLKAEAAEGIRERTLSYSASAQKLEIVDALTRKADGRKIKVPKGNYQLHVASGRKGAAALFSDWNSTTVVFPDVQAGDAVELSYRIVTRQPLFPGKFSREGSFNRGYAYDRVNISVDAPADMKLLHEARQMEFSQKVVGKRQLLNWSFSNPKPVISERADYSVYDYDSEPGFAVSSFESQREIVQRYVDRAAPKAAVTPRIQELADKITQGAEGPRAQTQALYDWVAREISYAGNCVGIGAVVPRDLVVVLDNRMGDCKDHATLLQALLQAKGIASHQVLVNAGSQYRLPAVPVLSMVNHVINYVPSVGLFLDSTSGDTLFGDLPVVVQDKPVLAAADDVPARTPKDDGRASQKVKAVYRIAADGSFQGEVALQAQGRFGQQMRLGFKGLSKDQLETVVKRHFEGARIPADGQLLKTSDPQQRSDDFSYEAKFQSQPLLRLGSAGAFGIGPFLFSSAPVPAYAQYAVQPAEDHPTLCFSSHSEEEYEITLPDNMQVLSVPEGVAASGPLVSYESSYKLEGRVLHVKRSVTDRMPGNVCTAEVNAAYREAMQPLLNDLRQQVLYK